MRKALSASIDSLPPAVRYRVRNAIALARWVGRVAAGPTVAAAGAYDDTFWDLHARADWAGMAALVLRHCRPSSIVDVGCGDGMFLAALRQQGPALRLLGLDSSPAALRRARVRGIDVADIDLAGWRTSRTTRLIERIRGFDLAVCLETAEHLPPWCAGALVTALAAAPAVLFSAAHPNQLGTLHMNEQPFEYWRRKFEAAGLGLVPNDAAVREEVAALNLPPWYAANVHLFRKSHP